MFAVLAISSLTSASALPAPADILADATRASSYYLAHEEPKEFADHSWEKATHMIGLMELYRATGEKALLDHAYAWGEANAWKLAGHKKSELAGGPKPIKPKGIHNADNQLCAATYAEIYAIDPNETYIKDAVKVLGREIEGSERNYWSWIDAIHMAMNAYSRIGNVTGDDRYFETMFEFYNVTANEGNPADGINTFHLWNESVGLFYRDARYWESNTFWSRGDAWAFTALARSLEVLPNTAKFDSHRREYQSKFTTMAQVLKQLQGADGAWRASLLNVTEYPSPETTGSANFAYGLAFGMNTGLLSKKDYMPTLEKAWAYLSQTALQADGLVGYCQPVGSSPSDTSPSSTSDFCVGQFLLAATQTAKLAADEHIAMVV